MASCLLTRAPIGSENKDGSRKFVIRSAQKLCLYSISFISRMHQTSALGLEGCHDA